MEIQIGLVLSHITLLVLCFLLMLNRYLDRAWKNKTSLILNLFIAFTLIQIIFRYGTLKGLTSFFLYLMYMIIMNKVAFAIVQRLDKSKDLMDELEKKLKDKK